MRQKWSGLILLAAIPVLNAAGYGNDEIQWPINFVIAPDKAIVSNDRLFDEGDTVTFFFEAAESSLFMNCELWQSWKLPKPKEPHKPGWSDTLMARYRADTLGTQGRLRRAFDSMDKSSLDPTFNPEIGSTQTQLTVRFRGRAEIVTIILESPREDPRRSSETDVKRLMEEMARSGSFLEIHYPSRGSTRWGKAASELLEVLHRAELGVATEEDFATARRHYLLWAVQAIQGKSRR